MAEQTHHEVTIYFTEGENLKCSMTEAERSRLTTEYTKHVNAHGNSSIRSGVYTVQVGNQQKQLAVNFNLVRYIC